MCKWVGLGIVGAQVLSIFQAMVLRAVGSSSGSYYNSDNDYIHPYKASSLEKSSAELSIFSSSSANFSQ